jgi:hypothetical protein
MGGESSELSGVTQSYGGDRREGNRTSCEETVLGQNRYRIYKKDSNCKMLVRC